MVNQKPTIYKMNYLKIYNELKKTIFSAMMSYGEKPEILKPHYSDVAGDIAYHISQNKKIDIILKRKVKK